MDIAAKNDQAARVRNFGNATQAIKLRCDKPLHIPLVDNFIETLDQVGCAAAAHKAGSFVKGAWMFVSSTCLLE